VTRLHAVRVAARLRRELDAEVDLVGGSYGQFLVLIDGATVVDGGAWAALGVLPSGRAVVEAVRARLDRRQDDAHQSVGQPADHRRAAGD
jgi:hypothetical protein